MQGEATIEVRVARRRTEALDIVSFELAPSQDGELPPFSAGAHIDVHLPDGKTIRQYSLCNAAGDTQHYLIAVLRDPGSRGGSVAMHSLVNEGDIVRISGPRNHFPLARDAGHSILIGGGIGVTPLLCMAERLNQTDSSFEMHYCTRSAQRTAFRERIMNGTLRGRVHFHFDDGPEQQRFRPEATLANSHLQSHLYVCGPTGFMRWILDSAQAAGWPQERIHREYFAADPIDHIGDGTFDIRIASSGKTIRVAADQTVVAALAAHGIEVPVSCEQGVCGTCLTRVLAGEPDHKDLFLTPAEQAKNDQFTPCCSRAKSTSLTLDL